MKFSEFQQSAASPQPIYTLLTKETFFRQQVYEFCRAQVEASARNFDWSVFDLEEDSVLDVVNTARTLPWMALRRWVYVRDSANAGGGLLSTTPIAPLHEQYSFWRPPGFQRKWPKVPSHRIREESGPGMRWVVAQLQKEGYRIEPKGCSRSSRVGRRRDLQRLSRELEKQQLAQWESKEITLEAVRAMTLQSREYDVFALIGAMAAGQRTDGPTDSQSTLRFGCQCSPDPCSSLLEFPPPPGRRGKCWIKAAPFRLILKELKIWSYRGRERAVRSYSLEWLETTLLGIRQTDRLCKTTSGESRFHLERLLIDSCRKSPL